MGFLVFFFVWEWLFLEFHKTAKGGGCFLFLQCFSVSVWVWDMRFSAHDLHGSMLKRQRCGCGGMQRLVFSAQEFSESIDSEMQVGQLAWPIRNCPPTAPTQPLPISNFALQKADLKKQINKHPNECLHYCINLRKSFTVTISVFLKETTLSRCLSPLTIKSALAAKAQSKNLLSAGCSWTI